MTTTLRKWFQQFTDQTGETPTKIVLHADRYSWEENEPLPYPEKVVMKFSDVPAQVLDEEFDDGYGGTNSPDFCAWSKNWVILSCQYDGAEWPVRIPRHPKDHTPERPGGG